MSEAPPADPPAAAPPPDAAAAVPADAAALVAAPEAAAVTEIAADSSADAMKVSSPGAKKNRLDGPAKQALDLKYERLQGKVDSYEAPTDLVSNGFGYVTSHLFPDKVLFRQERVMPEFVQHPFQAGEDVEFDVQADEQGRAHAVMLKPFVHRTPHDCIGQRHRGYVRRCAERWGFLNAAAFDGDLFVHRDNLLLVPGQAIEGQPPLRTGQPVTFDVAEDDRKRAVARQITTHALPRPGDMIGSRLTGQVRSFQGAWGFIISDSFAGDLFVHRDSFTIKDPQVNVGMMVAFNVERDQRRKGSKDRLVARQVEILSAGDPSQAMMPQAMAGGYQQPLSMDPYAQMAGAMNPAYSVPPQMYYPQMTADGLSYAQPYPYAQSPYMQQPLMQPQAQVPVMPQVMPQQPYAQQMQLKPTAQNAYLPAGVAPISEATPPTQQPAAVPKAGEMPPPGGADPSGGQGLLHITMHDWEPDQPGQLWVTKGTLVNVSYRAAHGWVYAATHQPGDDGTAPTSEGWLPQAVVKRVSLCRVAMDWPAEGAGTLGVTKGEVVAVSKEAERGWVYGERIGPRTGEKLSDGWLPKKVLDYLQS